jgi:hypothetical protein
MTRRRKGFLTLLILLVVVCGLAVLFQVSREPLLMERAARVTDTHNWSESPINYFWISDRELLFLPRADPSGLTTQGNRFFKRDIVSGQETYLEKLTQRFQESTVDDWLAISPDGKRLCWTAFEAGGDKATATGFGHRSDYRRVLHAAALDGSAPFKLSVSPEGFLAWMGAGNRIVAYVTHGDQTVSGTIYDIEKGKSIQQWTAPTGTREQVFVRNNRCIEVTWQGQDAPDAIIDRAEISEAEVGKEAQTARKYSVRLPVRGYIGEVRISPQADRVVWPLMQDSATPSRAEAWLHRLVPAFKLPPKSKTSLWVSRIDGSEMHEIGYIPLRPDKENGGTIAGDEPDHLDWLPDGKRLSFQLHNALYIVPAK